MRRRTLSAVLSVVLVLGALLGGPVRAARQEAPEYGPPKGTLVIVGGGNTNGTGIVERFIEIGGGPEKGRFVIVPTAGGNRNNAGALVDYKEDDVIRSWVERGPRRTRK